MARKSKGFGELIKKEEKMTAYREEGFEQLTQKVKETPFGELVRELKYNPKGVEKMSVTLKKFVIPYTNSIRNVEEYDSLLDLAVLVWNATLLPPEKEQEIINELIEEGSLEQENPEVFRKLVEELVDRKKRHFPNNKRLIVEYNVIDAGDEYRISVMSTD